MNRRIIYIMIVMMISTLTYSQQLPHYSLYMFNDVVINPAVCGNKEYSTVHLISRSQWAGFEGSPKTQLLSYQRKQGDKIGLGATIINDATGPISRTGTQLTYSYRMPVFKDYQLSFGLSGSINQYVFDPNKATLHDNLYDPAISEGIEKVMTPDATFGMYMYNQKYYLGVSVPNLIESSINLSSLEEGSNKMIRHFFITSGYKFILNSDFVLQPSLLFKSTSRTPFQYDINLMTRYRDKVWIGTSYRDKDALVFMLGMDYQNYSFGYSFDKSISDISSYTNGSHGVMIGYTFGRQKDSDGDGISDDRDDCPYEFGLKENNGCPDTDGDGVLDKNDNCPKEAGLRENGGCPDQDGDKVIDKLDECPKTAGPIENNGCPELTVEQAAVVDTVFSNLEFVFGKSDIKFNSYSHLEKLGVMLSQNPDMRLKISGHTDNVGGDELNIQLSKDRANEVKEFLIDRGINAEILIVLYFGKDKPIATNDTEEGRSKNRRVEFDIFFE